MASTSGELIHVSLAPSRIPLVDSSLRMSKGDVFRQYPSLTLVEKPKHGCVSLELQNISPDFAASCVSRYPSSHPSVLPERKTDRDNRGERVERGERGERESVNVSLLRR